MENASAVTKAEVRSTPAGPALYVNGQLTAPMMLYVYGADEICRGEIADAAANGVNIVTFLDKPWIEIDTLPWPKDGEEADYSAVDSIIDRILSANPNALLLPRFVTDRPPDWWKAEHPDDMMLYDDGTLGLASLHSRRWREDAARNVTALVKHLEAKYCDRTIGYHPCGQTSAEWFFEGLWEGRLAGFEPVAASGFRKFLRQKYSTDKALQSAWHDPDVTLDTADVPTLRQRTHSASGEFCDPMTEQNAIDFYEFQNAEVADAAEAMCRAVKEAAPNKLTALFFGYHFELSVAHGLQSSGHLGLGRLLKSKYVDIICSPISYSERGPGGIPHFMAPVDSVQLNGKLWLTEDDTRTYLSEADSYPGRCADARETYEVLSENFSSLLTRGSAVWWMDIGGTGWYSGEEMWQYLGSLARTYRSAMPHFERYSPEIAVIVDERSCLYTAPTVDVTRPLVNSYRKQFNRMGAPVGLYLLDDLTAGKVPPAKMYLFLDTFRLDADQIEAVRKHACRKGCTVVWMYAPGIVRDGTFSTANVQEVTGITLKEITTGDGRIVIQATGAEFAGKSRHLSPTFAVDDAQVEIIARYADGGEIAAASKNIGSWTSVYSGALQLPSSALRDLAKKAGVHIYTDGDDPIMAGNGFAAIHASSDGTKTLRMPTECRLLDTASGVELEKASVFTFDMKKGDTRVFEIVRD